MPLTSFDATFDFTFARAGTTTTPPFPPVGNDGGGGIPGAVLPVSTDPSTLASCLHPNGQDWERWAGVPISMPSFLLPFIIRVDLPEDVFGSPYCTQALQIVDADTGAVVLTPYELPLSRVSDGQNLFIMHAGSNLQSGPSQAVSLPPGTYRIKLADAVSEPFTVKSVCGCNLLRVRLLNDTRIGNLLYGTAGWYQLFYIEGDLSGPTYEESETRTGSEKTAATLKKIWTLTLEGVSEPIADALSMAGLHRLVEVSLVSADAVPYRPITAMAHEAKAAISVSDAGGFDVTLTLPVSLTSWSSVASGSGCLPGEGTGALTELVCAAP